MMTPTNPLDDVREAEQKAHSIIEKANKNAEKAALDAESAEEQKARENLNQGDSGELTKMLEQTKSEITKLDSIEKAQLEKDLGAVKGVSAAKKKKAVQHILSVIQKST